MNQNTPLKSSIRRILFRRLGVTVLGVSLLFAVLSFYHSNSMVKDAVIQTSRIRINVMRGRFHELMKTPGMDMSSALHDAVHYPPHESMQIQEGEFIYAQLHSANRASRGDYQKGSHAALDKVKSYLLRAPATYPAYGQIEYKPFTIDGQSYLDIHSRLTQGDGAESVLYLRAIFALSKESASRMHKQALQLVLYGIAVIIGTALLIYPVIVHLINKLADFSTGLLTAQLETMEALGAAIAKRDSATDIHNYRVTIYAVAMGERLDMDEKQMQCLIKGAFLHDVGKIGIRDNILLNKERLDAHEFAIMKEHVRHGLDIIEQSSWLQDARDVVGSHHEQYDGSGYPAGLAGEEIPLSARIFAIVDVFDALTSRRPYKEPFSYPETMGIMEEERATHFDSALLDIFEEISQKLYDEYSGREDDGLKARLQIITDTYFHSGLSTIRY